MSLQNGRDYLYLIWKDVQSRRQYIVGELIKNGQFEFQYCEEVEQAIEHGFTPLVCFPDLDKKYVSSRLFPVFSSRLPDRKRKDMKKILDKYGLEEYEEYALLKRSGARLPIDTLEFIDPIFDSENSFERTFFIAGVRHYIECNGEKCEQAIEIIRADEVYLRCEQENKFDYNAVQVIDKNDILLGYVPRYYSEGITKLLQQQRDISCHVFYVDKSKNCNECIKLILTVK